MDGKASYTTGERQAYQGKLNAVCSIYSSAYDNEGRYRDPTTGEPIERMTIHDFLMTDRYRPQVERLRQLIAEYGPDVKKTEVYETIKKSLRPHFQVSSRRTGYIWSISKGING